MLLQPRVSCSNSSAHRTSSPTRLEQLQLALKAGVVAALHHVRAVALEIHIVAAKERGRKTGCVCINSKGCVLVRRFAQRQNASPAGPEPLLSWLNPVGTYAPICGCSPEVAAHERDGHKLDRQRLPPRTARLSPSQRLKRASLAACLGRRCLAAGPLAFCTPCLSVGCGCAALNCCCCARCCCRCRCCGCRGATPLGAGVC